MQRVFIEDAGRFKRGDVRDWPRPTWQGVADWETVTAPVEQVLGEALSRDATRIDPELLQSPRRGQRGRREEARP
jgi:hypothetical protein